MLRLLHLLDFFPSPFSFHHFFHLISERRLVKNFLSGFDRWSAMVSPLVSSWPVQTFKPRHDSPLNVAANRVLSV